MAAEPVVMRLVVGVAVVVVVVAEMVVAIVRSPGGASDRLGRARPVLATIRRRFLQGWGAARRHLA